jgi:hypothetical protein
MTAELFRQILSALHEANHRAGDEVNHDKDFSSAIDRFKRYTDKK